MKTNRKIKKIARLSRRSTAQSFSEDVTFKYVKGVGHEVEVKVFKSGQLVNKVKVLALSNKEFDEIMSL